MKLALTACLVVAPVVVPGAAAAEVTVIDNGKTQTLDCAKDPELSLIGNHLTITLTGTCKKLKITGNHEVVTGAVTVVFVAGNENTLTVDAVDEITVAGNSNSVSWKPGGKSKTAVTNKGKSNKIVQQH